MHYRAVRKNVAHARVSVLSNPEMSLNEWVRESVQAHLWIGKDYGTDTRNRFICTQLGQIYFEVLIVNRFGSGLAGAARLNMALVGPVRSCAAVQFAFIKLHLSRPDLERTFRSPFGISGAFIGGVLAMHGAPVSRRGTVVIISATKWDRSI